MATNSLAFDDDSWIVVDDAVRHKDDEIDEGVLNPMSMKARLNNRLFHGIRMIKQKVSSSTRRSRSMSEATTETMGAAARLGARSTQRQRSEPNGQSTVTTRHSFTHSPSVPIMIQSGAEGLPPASCPDGAAAENAQVLDELNAKERELANLELKLEMKDQESQEHKMKVDKLHRQIEILTDQRIQQKLESGQKVETVKKDGERKLSRMKQKLNMEQKKSKQKEDEIDNLKAQLAELQLQTMQQEDMLQTQEELLCKLRVSASVPSQAQFPPSAEAASDVVLKSTTVDFSDRFIGRLIATHSIISAVVDDVAKSSDVTVNIFAVDDTATRVQTSLTGTSQDGIAAVEKEIRLLDRQLQFDIKSKTMNLGCMFAPLLLSTEVVDALAEIEQTHHVEISVFEHSRAQLTVNEFSLCLGARIAERAMCLTDLNEFRRPSKAINISYEWKVNGNEFKDFHLGRMVNEYLSACYCSNQRKATINIGGYQFVADVNALQLVKVATGGKYTLVKEYKQPIWSYAVDANTFADHSAADSDALEKLYRYGGSHITLAGSKHTLDLSTMQQVNLETGERVAVKRDPAVSQAQSSISAPDFIFELSVRGLGDGLDAGIKAIEEKLQSYISSCTVTSDLAAIVPQDWQEIILIKIYNAARQYCLKIQSFGIQNGKLSLQLQGAKNVIDKAQITLKEYILDFQQNVLSLVHSVLLENLQSSASAADVYPSNWQAQKEDIDFFEVQAGSPEWTGVVDLMKETIPSVVVCNINRIQNIKLWDKYALEKKQMSERNNGEVNETYLFHGTRDTDPLTIIRSVRGIDFRYSRRDYQLLWGTGAYFAENASYSDRYCFIDQTLGIKQLLLVQVLTGKSCNYGDKNDPTLTKPPPLSQGGVELYDTVTGYTNGSYVYVVYDHDRAYPAYLIDYVS